MSESKWFADERRPLKGWKLYQRTKTGIPGGYYRRYRISDWLREYNKHNLKAILLYAVILFFVFFAVFWYTL